MKIIAALFGLTVAAALGGCYEGSRSAYYEGRNIPETRSKGYELGAVNRKRNPSIDDWNGAFATDGSPD